MKQNVCNMKQNVCNMCILWELILNSNALTQDLNEIFFSKANLIYSINNTRKEFHQKETIFWIEKQNIKKYLKCPMWCKFIIFLNMDIKFSDHWLNMEDLTQIDICDTYLYLNILGYIIGESI